MPANSTKPRQAKEVRIGIPLKAYLRFSHQINEQLSRLEERTLAAIPQLARRGVVKERRSSERS